MVAPCERPSLSPGRKAEVPKDLAVVSRNLFSLSLGLHYLLSRKLRYCNLGLEVGMYEEKVLCKSVGSTAEKASLLDIIQVSCEWSRPVFQLSKTMWMIVCGSKASGPKDLHEKKLEATS